MAKLHNICNCEACTITVSHNAEWVTFFPTPRNDKPKKGKKMAKADTFKLVIKDGSSTYRWDDKTSQYGNVKEDTVLNFDNLAEALSEFLMIVTDEYETNKVTLSFVRGKKK